MENGELSVKRGDEVEVLITRMESQGACQSCRAPTPCGARVGRP